MIDTLMHWHIGRDVAIFYAGSKPVFTLPARQYAILIAELATALKANIA